MVNMRIHTPPPIPIKLQPDSPSPTLPQPGNEMTSLQRLAVSRLSASSQQHSPRTGMEQEKKIRREIANSNERRRMQSINTGFLTLRSLLPKRDGEKMSKASILQQTADFIQSLQEEKTELMQQNEEYKKLLETHRGTPVDIPLRTPQHHNILPPPKKRKTAIVSENTNSESSDDGMGLSENEATKAPTPQQRAFPPAPPPQWEVEVLQSNLSQMQLALDRERRIRILLEDQLRTSALSGFQLQSLGRFGTVPSVLDFPGGPGLSAFAPPSQEMMTSAPTLPSTTYATLGAAAPPQKVFGPPNPSSNLEAIVEAIRHLEGDQLFVDTSPPRPNHYGLSQLMLDPHRSDSGISSPSSEKTSTADPFPLGLRPPIIVPSVHG